MALRGAGVLFLSPLRSFIVSKPMDNQNQKPRRWLKIASYIGLGLLALETALLVGAGVTACNQKAEESQALDGARITVPVAKPFNAVPRPEGYVNLLDNADHYHKVNIGYGAGGDPAWANLEFYRDDNFITDIVRLSVGRYYLGVDGDDVAWSTYCQMTPTQYTDWDVANEMSALVTAIEGGATAPHFTIENAMIGLDALAYGAGDVRPLILSLRSPVYFIIRHRSVDTPYIYLIDETSDVSDVTINLPSTYDFRRWVGNVDPATGCLSLESTWSGGIGFRNFVFPFVWRAGDGNVYNYIYLNVIGVQADNALIINGNGEAKLASNIFGSNWNKFSMLMSVRYGFDPSYDGTYIEKYNEQVSLNPMYTALAYTNPLISGSIDGQGVSAFDCRAVYLDPFYRFFDVYQDRGEVFSTPAYTNITTGQLLGMDLYTITMLGDASTSPISLLTQGFNAIANILSIQLLPNLTLGLLLFIPLIVTVILVIVRLLQK